MTQRIIDALSVMILTRSICSSFVTARRGSSGSTSDSTMVPEGTKSFETPENGTLITFSPIILGISRKSVLLKTFRQWSTMAIGAL